MGGKEDVFLGLIFIFQLVIFMALKIAASWLKKINNGWQLTFHKECNLIDIHNDGDELPLFQQGACSLTIGGKWIDEGGGLFPH